MAIWGAISTLAVEYITFLGLFSLTGITFIALAKTVRSINKRRKNHF